MILGSGPNRIGQGIEFDYCCVHAVQTVRESGRDAVMINCNPETVSTDYDTSDRLYFEPLTLEDVLAVCEVEQPEGVVVQFGGQTPLKLAAGLEEAGVPILGTSIDAIDLAEDRARFGALLDELGYTAPPYATARGPEEALGVRRPGRVPAAGAAQLRARRPRDGDRLQRRRPARLPRARSAPSPDAAIFLDRFLEDSIEVDVDAICDGTDVWVAGIMQHVEEAGIHSGDSACVLPPHTLGAEMIEQIREQTVGIARALGVVGLLNVQFAIHGEQGLHVIEANPRASRTVPFVSKAIGLPLAKLACRVVLGEKLADLDLPEDTTNGHVCVKEAVLPFNRFMGADSLLGPEMRSTGEVMGIARDFPTAFAKAQAAAGAKLPDTGTAFITVADSDKAAATGLAALLDELGFRIIATRGTAQAIRRQGIPAEAINKIGEGSPHVVDWIERGDVDIVINTPVGTGARSDGYEIRTAAIAHGIPCITTISGGIAAARAISAGRRGAPEVLSLQEVHASSRAPGRADAGGALSAARSLAPFGRRLAAVTASESSRRVRRAPLRRPRVARRHSPVSSTCWPRRPDGAGETASGRSCRALSAFCGRSPADAGAIELQFLVEDVGPGTQRLCELGAGDGLLLVGPLGAGFALAARGRRPLLVGGGVGIAPLAILQDELGAETAGAARVPRRGTRRRRGAALGSADRHRRRQRRPSRARHRAARIRARAGARTSSRCTRAARRRCSTRSG